MNDIGDASETLMVVNEVDDIPTFFIEGDEQLQNTSDLYLKYNDGFHTNMST